MADDDALSDAKGDIASYITRRISELFNREFNRYNWPAWMQAALLFDEFVIPCDYTPSSQLYNLAGSIVDESLKNDNKIQFFQYSGETEIPVGSKDITENIKRIKAWMKDNREFLTLIEEQLQELKPDFVSQEVKIVQNDPEEPPPTLNQVRKELEKIRNHKGFLQLLKLDLRQLSDEQIIELLKLIDEHTVISSEFRREKFRPILRDLTTNYSDELKARAFASFAFNFSNTEDREFIWENLFTESDEFLDLFFYEVGDIEWWYGKIFSEEEIHYLKKLAKNHPIFSNTIISYLASLNDKDIGDLMIELYYQSKDQQLNVLRYFSENPSKNAKDLLINDITNHNNSTSRGVSSRLVLASIALSGIEEEDAIDIVLKNCYDLYYWVAQIAQRYLQKRLIKEEDNNIRIRIEKTLEDLKPQTYMISPDRAEKVFENLRKEGNKKDKNHNNESDSGLFI